MKVEVSAGNILDVPADVLISTANPWLQMTGGVNLAIIIRPKGDDVFAELQAHLCATGKDMVDPGTVVCTGPGSLPVKHILHAVSIDPSYDSSIDLVATTIVTALTRARELDAKIVTLAALATGFGPLLMHDFGAALRQALARDWTPLECIKVVVKHEEEAATIRTSLGAQSVEETSDMQPSTEQLAAAVSAAASQELTKAVERISHCVDQLTDAQVWQRESESMNSIGNLILHLCGNLRQWIVAGLGGEPDVRERPLEVSERGSIPKAELLRRLEDVVAEARTALMRATPAELLRRRCIQGFEVNGLEAIFDSVPHFRGHTQEIIHLTRSILGDAYQFAWIAPE